MKKTSDSKLGFEVGSGLKKSQSKYSYEGICKLYGGSMKNFTEKELEILKRIANSTWTYIAPDLQGAVESPTPRDSVFEVVVDADRLVTFANSEEEKKVVKKFYSLSWDEMNALKEKLFPFEHYE